MVMMSWFWLLGHLQDGTTPLSVAAQSGHTECVDALVSSSDTDVNQANKVRV